MGDSKISIFQLSCELRQIWKFNLSQYSQPPILHLFHELGKIENSTRATFKNPNIQSFCELEKWLKYGARPTFKNPIFESKSGLRKPSSNFSFNAENKK